MPNTDNFFEMEDAISSGDIDKLTSLIAAGADVNEVYDEDDPYTLLSYAEMYKNSEIINLLLKSGADIKLTAKYKILADGENALRISILRKELVRAKALMSQVEDINYQGDLDDISDGNNTPLMHAAFEGYTHIIEFLINSGADVDLKNSDKETALIIAANQEYSEAVELLINAGADLNLKDMHGRTALTNAELLNACGTENEVIIKLLLDAGEDRSIKNNDA